MSNFRAALTAFRGNDQQSHRSRSRIKGSYRIQGMVFVFDAINTKKMTLLNCTQRASDNAIEQASISLTIKKLIAANVNLWKD